MNVPHASIIFGCDRAYMMDRILDSEFKRLASTIAPATRLEKKMHFAFMELKENRNLFMKVYMWPRSSHSTINFR